MKRRIISNDDLFTLYNYWKNNGKSVRKTAKQFKMNKSKVYSRLRAFDKRLQAGEFVTAIDNNNNAVRVKLNPIVTTYPNMDNAWAEIYNTFDDQQRAVIFKFYNTVLSNAGILTETEASYEQ